MTTHKSPLKGTNMKKTMLAIPLIIPAYVSAYPIASGMDFDPVTLPVVSGTVTAASAPVAKTFNNPTRTLNTAFQISTAQDADVTYSVDVTCTMSLTSGQSGTVVLEYADDAGFTTNVKTSAKPTNANSGALTIGLALTQINGVVVHGLIPATKYARIRTINNTGTPTYTLQNAQEVLN